MAGRDPADITSILKRITRDGSAGYAALLPLVYDELRRMAEGYLRKERTGHTLQPTALVHEAYVRLINHQEAGYQDRVHFLAVAARAMRQVLVDHARARGAAKRGGQMIKVTLDESTAASAERDVDLVVLSEALADLEHMDQRKGRVVELRFFAGLTNEETARVLGVSPKTTEADWYFARAWLRRKLSEEQPT